MLFRLRRRRRRRRCQALRRVKGCRFVLSVNLDLAIKPLSKHNSFCMQLYIIFPRAPHPGPPQQTWHSLPIPLIPPPFPLLDTSHTTVIPRPSPRFSSPSPPLHALPTSLSLSPASPRHLYHCSGMQPLQISFTLSEEPWLESRLMFIHPPRIPVSFTPLIHQPFTPLIHCGAGQSASFTGGNKI